MGGLVIVNGTVIVATGKPISCSCALNTIVILTTLPVLTLENPVVVSLAYSNSVVSATHGLLEVHTPEFPLLKGEAFPPRFSVCTMTFVLNVPFILSFGLVLGSSGVVIVKPLIIKLYSPVAAFTT